MSERDLALAVFLGFFALLLAGVLVLPRHTIYRGAPDRARWRDLRLWALLLVAIHAWVYWIFR